MDLVIGGACPRPTQSRSVFGKRSREANLCLALDEGINEDAERPTLMVQAATPDTSLVSSALSSSVGNQRDRFTSGSVSDQDAFLSDSDNCTAEERILAAVEFYFSDEHVAKDAFMYRHIMRGKGGFVNMKLVASFRKVKNITKDWTVVRDAVKSSSVLQLNEECTKLKRIVPFSPSINPLAKCVLVYNLGSKPSMGVVEQHLEKFGRICKISIYFPGQAVPNEVRIQRTRLEIPATEPLAVVDFSTSEEARKIIAEIQDSPPTDGPSIKVALLNMRSGSTSSGFGSSMRLDSVSSDAGSESERPRQQQRSQSCSDLPEQQPTHKEEYMSDCSQPPKSPQQGTPTRRRKKKSRHLSCDESGTSPKSSPPSNKSTNSITGNATTRQRHRSQCGSTSSIASQKSLSCDGVVRQPLGPSGQGFVGFPQT